MFCKDEEGEIAEGESVQEDFEVDMLNLKPKGTKDKKCPPGQSMTCGSGMDSANPARPRRKNRSDTLVRTRMIMKVWITT